MKTILKTIIRDEGGAALFLALILLLIGGLIAASLLGYMGTGLLVGEVYDTRTAELYAADAGVEDAIWKISHQSMPLGSWQESDDQPGWWVYEYPQPLIVNGKSVDVTLYRKDQDPTCGQELIYRILATATTEDGGGVASIPSATTVEAYVTPDYSDYSGLLDNAITSGDDILIHNNIGVSGNISLPPDGDLDPPDFVPQSGVVNYEALIWPTGQQMADFYWPDVEHLTPVPDGYEIIIPSGTTEDDPYVIESLSAEGNLTIKGSGWVKIGGTIYIKGDLSFSTTPEISIDMNQQTVFAEYDIEMQATKVNFSGSGCIIGVGDVDYHPNNTSGPEDFLLVMSVEGTLKFQPGNSFYGSLVGKIDVTLQPGIDVAWVDPEGKGINFPGMDPTDPSEWTWTIDSWEVSQQ